MKKSFSIISTTIIFVSLAVISLLFSIFQFAYDNVLFATGKLVTTEYSVADFNLKDLDVLDNGNLRTTTPDPQLILPNYNASGTMVLFKFKTEYYPGEVTLYYTRNDEDFSNTRKIFGNTRNDGTFEFVLPRGVIASLRLDPSNFTGLEIAVESIVFNPKRSFISYFSYSGEYLFMFFVTAILLSCFSKCMYEGFHKELSAINLKLVLKRRKK